MSGVEDRVIVVTGAGRGIGREYALYLARHGAKVVVNDLGVDVNGRGKDSSAAQLVVEEITKAGGTAIANHDSVSSADGAQAIISTALDSFDHLDAVVNNAGILRDVTLLKMTDDDFDAVMKTHLYGTLYVIRAAWPHFRDQGHGRVVVTTSTAGLYGNFGQTNYASAKMGVVGMIKTLSLEGAKYNILCNAVSPGGATRMTTRHGADPAAPLDPARDPAWPAPAVAYMCSQGCQDTGLIIRASGGRYRSIRLARSAGAEFEAVPDLGTFTDAWPRILDMSSHDFEGGGGAELGSAADMNDLDESSRYWAAIQERRFELPTCITNAHAIYYPRNICPICHSREIEWREYPDARGSVYSFTVSRRARSSEFESEVPYLVALVDLVAGARMLTNVVDVSVEDVHIGMAVRMTFAERAGRVLPVFIRDPAEGAPSIGDFRND